MLLWVWTGLLHSAQCTSTGSRSGSLFPIMVILCCCKVSMRSPLVSCFFNSTRFRILPQNLLLPLRSFQQKYKLLLIHFWTCSLHRWTCHLPEHVTTPSRCCPVLVLCTSALTDTHRASKMKLSDKSMRCSLKGSFSQTLVPSLNQCFWSRRRMARIGFAWTFATSMHSPRSPRFLYQCSRN